MWAGSIWGFITLSATCFFGMLALPPELAWARPWCAGATVAFFALALAILCWPLRDAKTRRKAATYLKHPIEWLMDLNGTSIVLFGLAVVIFGAATVGIGLWRQSSVTATAPKTIQQADVPIQNPGPAKHYQLVGTLPPKYTAYEKEQRLRAVDEIYNLMTTEMSSGFAESQALLKTFQSGIVDGTTKTNLLSHAKNVQKAFDDLNTLLKRYDYFQDIVSATRGDPFNGVEEINASTNLAAEIDFWNRVLKSEGINYRDVWNRDAILMEFAQSNSKFANYVRTTLNRLQAKRAEIESASVVQ